MAIEIMWRDEGQDMQEIANHAMSEEEYLKHQKFLKEVKIIQEFVKNNPEVIDGWFDKPEEVSGHALSQEIKRERIKDAYNVAPLLGEMFGFDGNVANRIGERFEAHQELLKAKEEAREAFESRFRSPEDD